MLKIFQISFLLLSAFSVISCSKNDENSTKTLTYSISEEIPVPEPSGLDLSYDEKAFWIVSDQNSKVYLIDSWGKEIKSFKVKGEDLEGITVVNDSLLAVVLERTNEVVIVDTSGNEIKRAALEIGKEFNSGLEGITFDRIHKKYFLLNEKKPKLLITLNENLEEISCDTLDFAKDFSGIFFDDTDTTLWILSDESQRIFNTDLSGKPIEEFKIKVTQPEGISFNKERTKLFIVSDKMEILYVFDLE